MHDVLNVLTPVLTRKPARQSTHWTTEQTAQRRWRQRGQVYVVNMIDGSDSQHPRPLYTVRHDDGSYGCYERRELIRADTAEHTISEKQEMIDKMRVAAADFYKAAIQTGVHAFIEFAGLMNEFIVICDEAKRTGIDFPNANTHSGVKMPFKPQHAMYLAEKLSCIYGPALLDHKETRDAFISVLLHGQYVARPSTPDKDVERKFHCDPIEGDDGNDGRTKDTPVRTMARVFEIAGDAPCVVVLMDRASVTSAPDTPPPNAQRHPRIRKERGVGR